MITFELVYYFMVAYVTGFFGVMILLGLHPNQRMVDYPMNKKKVNSKKRNL